MPHPWPWPAAQAKGTPSLQLDSQAKGAQACGWTVKRRAHKLAAGDTSESLAKEAVSVLGWRSCQAAGHKSQGGRLEGVHTRAEGRMRELRRGS